jgi:hypothetical protein
MALEQRWNKCISFKGYYVEKCGGGGGGGGGGGSSSSCKNVNLSTLSLT